jgi:type IX secretion system PorP/SprF family membrane protein
MVKRLQKAVLGTALGFLCLSGLKAQDIHFSQYNASPLLLNPALSGMNAGDYRVYANFRTQWVTVAAGNTYRTFAGGADMSIGKMTKYNSFAGVGISFFSDQAGDVSLNSNHVDLSFAYHFMLNHKGTMQLSAGLQGGFNHRSINPSKAVFDSQYDPTSGSVNPDGMRENFGRTKIMYADAGLGLVFSAITRKDANYYIGFALNHVNQPKVTFNINGSESHSERLPMKITLHGGASLPLSNRLALMPNFMILQQGTAWEFNLGCHLRTVLGNLKLSNTAIYFGAQYRGLLDAVIVSGRLDIKGVTCGLSYDINISKLIPSSKTIGAPEISLMYQGSFRKKPHPGHCPRMF